MKKLFILRGLPGSGKSTLAAWLVEMFCKAPGMSAVFHEADDFFIDDDGTYTFDRTQLAAAHIDCKVRVTEAMLEEVPVIVVSNTSIQNWQLRPYAAFAEGFGYELTVLTVESGLSNGDLAARNEHGCPEEKIGEMRANWEDYVNPRYVEEKAS